MNNTIINFDHSNMSESIAVDLNGDLDGILFYDYDQAAWVFDRYAYEEPTTYMNDLSETEEMIADELGAETITYRD